VTPHRLLRFSISIVSHRSGALIPALLADLRECIPADSEILVTLNVPEDEAFLEPFADLPLSVLRNPRQRGFGDNHNQAFAASRADYFVVVNPDIRLPASPFEKLVAGMAPEVGARAPVVLSPDGAVEDSIRRFPTFARLARRVLLRQRSADYEVTGDTPRPIDWSAGMFVVFRRAAFQQIGGFDTRYFMYMEDADICRRLRQAGYGVELVPGARVVHDAQRASHRSAEHMRWHLRSALRFLAGI
jgi:N-acetylglucosaminyl-diphospho-decaprenol L-rhamnosyltransferase